MNRLKYIVLVSFFMTSMIAGAEEKTLENNTSGMLKKVVILDFKNFDKNPNYQYLEASITDAVRKDLKERFAFKEMPSPDWQKLAKDNFFLWPDENYTKGFAMQMGLLGKSDIVMGGYYQTISSGNGPKDMQKVINGEIIRTHVFILDVGAKKLVSEFDMDFAADSTLFASINKIADRVADEAKSVLPNKGDFKQISVLEDEPMGLNEISVQAGVNLISVPAAFNGNFSSSSALSPKDIKNAFEVQISYTRHDFLKPHVFLSAAGGAQFGSGELKVATDTKTIHTSLLGFSLSGQAGYRFDKWKFFLAPFGGLGFYFGSIKLDYSTLSVLPVDSAGTAKSSANLNISAPFLEAGLHFGYQVSRLLAVQATGLYRQYFYIGATAGSGFVGGGLSFRM